MSDEKIDNYHSLNPAEFHDIHKVEIINKGNSEFEEIDVFIEIKSEDHKRILRYEFYDVSDFKYVPGYWSFAYIEIVPVDNGFEKIRYRVFESEQDTDFSLNCLDFDVSIVG